MEGDRAAFLRVLQQGGTQQQALVLLNKGNAPATFDLDGPLQAGHWRAALAGGEAQVADGHMRATVPAHGVEVYLLDAPVADPKLRAALDDSMRRTRRN
jgi:cyclomaltodextrin glucanotransferase